MKEIIKAIILIVGDVIAFIFMVARPILDVGLIWDSGRPIGYVLAKSVVLLILFRVFVLIWRGMWGGDNA
jgi:hypothetical protein